MENGPLTSVMVPRGMPPPSMVSTSAIPLAKTSGACLILSVSAAGTRCAKVDSIWTRIAAEEGIRVFALYSPIGLPFRQLGLLCKGCIPL